MPSFLRRIRYLLRPASRERRSFELLNRPSDADRWSFADLGVLGALRYGLLAVFVVGVVAWFMKDRLPARERVRAELYQAPIQTAVDLDPFEREVGGIVYTVRPLYDYELFGLVVSRHDSDSFFDYYHKRWKDKINVMDLCVVWGENIESEVYRDMTFTSGNWTCYYKPRRGADPTAMSRFCASCLSNNHLVTDKPGITAAIRRAGRGDQVRLAGYLCEYSHSGGKWRRGTSVTRDDTGNRACETIYVTDFEILELANVAWRALHAMCKYALLIGVAAYVVLWVRTPFRA